MRVIRAVIFDMDGVLTDSEPLINAAAVAMFREQGLAVQPDDFLPFVGTGEKRYLGGVAEKYGVTLRTPEDKNTLYAMYLEMIPGRLQPTPGAVAFVHTCRVRGFKTAVATSADRVKLEGALVAVGLPPHEFDSTVTGSDIVHAKPDPEIFLTAAARLGLPPAACLVVEDSPHGVLAARRAGCPCVALTTTFPASVMEKEAPDLVVDTLASADRIWRRWAT